MILDGLRAPQSARSVSQSLALFFSVVATLLTPAWLYVRLRTPAALLGMACPLGTAASTLAGTGDHGRLLTRMELQGDEVEVFFGILNNLNTYPIILMAFFIISPCVLLTDTLQATSTADY